MRGPQGVLNPGRIGEVVFGVGRGDVDDGLDRFRADALIDLSEPGKSVLLVLFTERPGFNIQGHREFPGSDTGGRAEKIVRLFHRVVLRTPEMVETIRNSNGFRTVDID